MRRNFQSFNLGVVGHARDAQTRCGYILAGRKQKGPLPAPSLTRLHPPSAPSGSLIAGGIAQDRDGDMRRNIGVQRYDQWEVSDVLQLAFGHAYHRLFDGMAEPLQRIDDVDVGHRAEQAAVDARFLCDLYGQASDLFGLSRRFRQSFAGGFFQLASLFLEQLEIFRRRALRLALRDQKIPGIALPDLDYFAEVTDVYDLFQQYDLHRCSCQCKSVYGSSAR